MWKLWVAALIGVCVSGIVNAGDQDFVLVNKTGVEIHSVYVSPSDQEEWGEDVMGEDTLPDGAKVEIKFSRKEKAELWDIKVTDGEGTSITWENLNLMEIAKVTLVFNAKTGQATAQVEGAAAEGGAQDFVLVNQTGVEIHSVFISPSDQAKWGEDVMGEDTLPNGAKVEIKFSPAEEAELWDIKVTDGEGGSITWEELNLLEIGKVTLYYNAKTGKATAKVE
jgi:hypothetical protein